MYLFDIIYDLPKTDVIFQWSTTNKSRWRGIKPTATREPADLFTRQQSRCPKSHVRAERVIIEAPFRHHYPMKRDGPDLQNLAARVESAQLASQLASKMERMTWKWLDLEHLVVELDTKFSLVWLLVSGSTCATNVTKKGIRNSGPAIRGDPGVCWNPRIGDVVIPSLPPLTTPFAG